MLFFTCIDQSKVTPELQLITYGKSAMLTSNHSTPLGWIFQDEFSVGTGFNNSIIISPVRITDEGIYECVHYDHENNYTAVAISLLLVKSKYFLHMY